MFFSLNIVAPNCLAVALRCYTKLTLHLPFLFFFTFFTFVGVTAVAWSSGGLADDHTFVATGTFWLGRTSSTGALGW